MTWTMCNPRPGACVALITVAAASLYELGCEAVIGADFGHRQLKSSRDAGGRMLGTGASPPPHCGILPGDVALEQGDDGGEMVFAIRTLDLGDLLASDGGFASLAAGLTQDELGTCEWPLSPRAWPRIDTLPEPSGLINAAAAGARAWSLYHPGATLSSAVASQIASGLDTSLFRLRGYSGDPTDPEIALDYFSGTMIGSIDAGRGDAGGRPTWQGQDTWLPLPSSVTPQGSGWKPRVSLRGSVEQSTLRVTGQDGPGWLASLHIEATLAHRTDGWHLDGFFAGAVRMKTLFELAALDGLCRGEPPYESQEKAPGYKQIWCQLRDKDTDGDGTCDAVSLGQGFEAVPARLACKPAAAASPCPADPSNDACE